MINCLAIDDEYLALEVIENYLERLPFIKLKASFTNPLDALPFLSKVRIDILFLDIEMPDMTGLDFLKTLKKPPLVIFLTAYSEFAVNGFEADAVDYLIKPFAFERFLSAIQKAQNRLKDNNQNFKAPSNLFIKSEHKTFRVDINEILFIEGKKDHVAIETVERSFNTQETINGLLEKLTKSNFIRVHRSFVVALNKIDRIERSNIVIREMKIPIGDQYREELINRIS